MAKLPSHFYKFRPCDTEEDVDRILQIIRDHHLYFAPACDFNDPFEFEAKVQTPTFVEYQKYIQQTQYAQARELKEMSTPDLRQVFKNVILDIHKNAYYSSVEEMKRKHGILCLSTSPLSVNLWSHYGGEHKGVCLEFINKKDSFFKDAQRVDYLPYPPKVNFFRDAVEEPLTFFSRTVYSKSDHAWDKEGEYRLISKLGNNDFPPDCLTTIYLGCRFENEKFLQALKAINPRMNVIKFKKAEGEYRLSIHSRIKAKSL